MTEISAQAAELPNFAGDSSLRQTSTIKRKTRSARHPDRTLIENCVEYASLMKGADAGYNIDPTDAEFAAVVDDISSSRAAGSLSRATRIASKTPDGLRAKAALATVILDRIVAEGLFVTADQIAFMKSAAADVVRFGRISRDAGVNRDAFPEPRK